MKNKKAFYVMIFFIFVFHVFINYLIGVITQSNAPVQITEGLSQIKPVVSYNPLVAIPKGFTSLIGLVVNLVIFVGEALLLYFAIFGQKTEFQEDPRGFLIAIKKGEYGTAHWMTDLEREQTLITDNIDNTQGNILGYIGPDRYFIDNDITIAERKANFKYAEVPSSVANEKVVSIPLKTRLGPHIAAFGASGSGKSFCFSRNLMFQCADRGESMIVTDPKGELYNDASVLLKRMGYVVKQFNLKIPSKSDSWNCLQECTSQGEEGIQLLVQQFTGIIIDNTTPPGGSGGGDSAFFDAAEGSLLTALCLYNLLDASGDLKGDTTVCLGDVYNMLTDRADLESKFYDLREANPDHPALKSYGGYVSGSDNVRGNIVTGLANRLQVLQADVIYEITGYQDIDLVLPAKQKCAYFIIISDQEATLKFLASLFFTFLFVRLVNYADGRPNQKCDVPVNMIMDEFPNIGIIPDFTKKISTVRSRDIRIMIIFQNLAQLEERYPNGQWQEILGNCDTQLCLGVRDEKTAKYLSEKTGECTTFQRNKQVQRKTMRLTDYAARYSESESWGKRFLMTPDEIQKLKGDKLIVFVAGCQPLILDKYGYIHHPDSKLLSPCSFMDHVPSWTDTFNKKREAIRDRVRFSQNEF